MTVRRVDNAKCRERSCGIREELQIVRLGFGEVNKVIFNFDLARNKKKVLFIQISFPIITKTQ